MKYSNFYKYLYFFIVLFYCFILSQYGMENFDTGYIPSFAWRIINGELPYEDFIYKGPPVTLYINAFFMKILPVTGQFYFFRVTVYLLFAVQIYFAVSAFDHIYDFNKLKIKKWGIMCACFVISLLNFSPYPWPTLDGLFFVSLAMWLMSRQKEFNIFYSFLIAICCVICAFTKQSFYLIPPLFIVWVFILYGFKNAAYFSIQIFVSLGIMVGFILSLTSLNNYIAMTTGETTLQQLWGTGFRNYLFIPGNFFLIAFLALFLAGFVYLRLTKQNIRNFAKLFIGTFFAIFIVSVLLVFYSIEFASRVAFNAAFIGILYLYLFEDKKINYLFPMLVCLAISWSVSISLGYPFPVLFATGIILTLLIILDSVFIMRSKIKRTYLFSGILIFTSLIAFTYNINPYREKNIFTLQYTLGTISPKLKYIKTNEENYEKHKELKNLIKKYGNNYIVAPNFSMANYLFDNQSKLPADWVLNTEVNREYNRFINLAAKSENFVFLEKSFITAPYFETDDNSPSSYIGRYIYYHFKKIDETKSFIVYNSIAKK